MCPSVNAANYEVTIGFFFLQKRFRFIYKKMVEKKMTQGFIVTEE